MRSGVVGTLVRAASDGAALGLLGGGTAPRAAGADAGTAGALALGAQATIASARTPSTLARREPRTSSGRVLLAAATTATGRRVAFSQRRRFKMWLSSRRISRGYQRTPDGSKWCTVASLPRDVATWGPGLAWERGLSHPSASCSRRQRPIGGVPIGKRGR